MASTGILGSDGKPIDFSGMSIEELQAATAVEKKKQAPLESMKQKAVDFSKMSVEDLAKHYSGLYESSISQGRPAQEGLANRFSQEGMRGSTDYLRKAAMLNADIQNKAKGAEVQAALQEKGQWQNLLGVILNKESSDADRQAAYDRLQSDIASRKELAKLQISSAEDMAGESRAAGTQNALIGASGQAIGTGAYLWSKYASGNQPTKPKDYIAPNDTTSDPTDLYSSDVDRLEMGIPSEDSAAQGPKRTSWRNPVTAGGVV